MYAKRFLGRDYNFSSFYLHNRHHHHRHHHQYPLTLDLLNLGFLFSVALSQCILQKWKWTTFSVSSSLASRTSNNPSNKFLGFSSLHTNLVLFSCQTWQISVSHWQIKNRHQEKRVSYYLHQCQHPFFARLYHCPSVKKTVFSSEKREISGKEREIKVQDRHCNPSLSRK